MRRPRFALDTNTYNANPLYALQAGFEGYVNATFMNNGTPLYYCQPHFYLVNSIWAARVQGRSLGVGGRCGVSGGRCSILIVPIADRADRAPCIAFHPGVREASADVDNSFVFLEPITGLGTSSCPAPTPLVRPVPCN